MHNGWNICPELGLAEEAPDNGSKRKEVIHCTIFSVILVYDFQSAKMVAIAEHLKWLRLNSFVERDARREEERREESREGRREAEEVEDHGRREERLRIFEGDLRDRLRLRRGECS